MIAQYGYSDGSGEFYVTIDTDRCDGCGACALACPGGVLAVLPEDPHDPFRAMPVAVVREEARQKIKYVCRPCQLPEARLPLPCVAACPAAAVGHSWTALSGRLP
ncbi:MAG: 4Fe-4S binding protein [Desulfobacterota bacterium]|jgi:Fe-S-cluster-containing hydrogenase component 2|nr:4Fe-4S binding protein [Thermodesulfobacteriota bacterium]